MLFHYITNELTGAEGLTFKEAVDIISIVTGRKIQFTGVSISAYVETLRQHELPEDFIWLIEYLFTEVLGNPSNSEITKDVELVLNRKPISFKDYAQETMKTGVWDAMVDQVK